MLGSVHDSPWGREVTVVAGLVLTYFDFLSSCSKTLWEHEARFPVNVSLRPLL